MFIVDINKNKLFLRVKFLSNSTKIMIFKYAKYKKKRQCQTANWNLTLP